jgi:hypothetical protein
MAAGAPTDIANTSELDSLTFVAEAVVAVRQAQHSALLPVDAGLGVLQVLADRLAELGTAEICPRALSRSLLSCRDRLASHIHAARALGEIEVGEQVTEDLMARGLDEVAAAVSAL